MTKPARKLSDASLTQAVVPPTPLPTALARASGGGIPPGRVMPPRSASDGNLFIQSVPMDATGTGEEISILF
jgi:hypothetical protein